MFRENELRNTQCWYFIVKKKTKTITYTHKKRLKKKQRLTRKVTFSKQLPEMLRLFDRWFDRKLKRYVTTHNKKETASPFRINGTLQTFTGP